MNISGASMESVLANMSTSNVHQQAQNELAVSILKQLMQQKEVEGAALVKMINESSLDGTGQMVNRTA